MYDNNLINNNSNVACLKRSMTVKQLQIVNNWWVIHLSFFIELSSIQM